MTTSTPPYLFVYGTLMTGRPAHGLVRPWVRSAAPARLRGRLYLMPPGYPALVLDDDAGWVQGEVLELDPAVPWARLDEYEGFDPRDPAGSLYRRGRRTVEVGESTRRTWCYWMVSPSAGARLLPEGRWPPR